MNAAGDRRRLDQSRTAKRDHTKDAEQMPGASLANSVREQKPRRLQERQRNRKDG